MRHLAAILLVFSLALGCSCPQPKAPLMVMDTLYFGGSVGEKDWDAYLAREVTPRFPDGLTHWQAKGQWREGKEAVAKEASQVLQILHAPGAEADSKLKALIEAFKIKFKQKSVLKVREGVEAEF